MSHNLSDPQQSSNTWDTPQSSSPPLPSPSSAQWHPLPPSSPPPTRYREALHILTCAYIAFWLCALAGSTNHSTILSNIGTSIYIGFFVALLILDARNVLSLQGLIRWKSMSRVGKTYIALLWLFLFLFLPAIYLIRTYSIHRHVPMPAMKRRENTALTVGICLSLLCVLVSQANLAPKSPALQSSDTTTSDSVVSAAPSNSDSRATVTFKERTSVATQSAKPTVPPTATYAVKPTATPVPPTQPPAPTPTPTPVHTGVNGNPWGYDFNASGGSLIYNPDAGFCGQYFTCVSTFWTATNGYVVECADTHYSHSGGVKGACSRNGGVAQALYSH